MYETKKDIALLGAFYRFIDEREKRGVKLKEEIKNVTNGIIYRADDLFFVDPQRYVVALYTTKSNERWSVHQWSNVGEDLEIGSVMVQSYLQKDMKTMITHLPVYENQTFEDIPSQMIFITLLLAVEIDGNELAKFAGNLYQTTKNRNHEGVEIQLQIVNANTISYYVPETSVKTT